MKVRLKTGLMVVTAESEEEQELVADWAREADGWVFSLFHQDGQTFRLTALGPRAQACRDPINVTSRSLDPVVQLISNFAHAPFELDGASYGSVEGFWQGLKFPDEARRREIAPLYGDAARRAGFDARQSDTFEYLGRTVRVGVAEHWRLMRLACWAKFTQCEAARQALLSTGERPLVHKTRRDSQSIPGVVMADIWMRVRRGLINRRKIEADSENQEEDVERDADEQEC